MKETRLLLLFPHFYGLNFLFEVQIILCMMGHSMNISYNFRLFLIGSIQLSENMVKYHFYTVLGSHFGFMQIMGWPHKKYIPNRFLVPHIYIILFYFTLKLYFQVEI